MPDLTRIPEFARPWAERCLASPGDVSDEDVRSVGDWLATLAIERPHLIENPGRLVRMTWAQAMEAQRKWHEGLAARTARLIAEKKGFGGAPDDVETVLDLEDGYRWVRVLSSDGLDYEGNAMGHCVGSGHYDEDGTILSLRDADNLPHCTVEWDEDMRVVHQVQGRANQAVAERYWPMLRSLVDQLNPDLFPNAASIHHMFFGLNGCPKRLVPRRDLNLQAGDHVHGSLDLSGTTVAIPDGLHVDGDLVVRGRTDLTHLPEGLVVEGHLDCAGCTSLIGIPASLVVGKNLNLDRCRALLSLPDHLTIQGSLILSACVGLRHLPPGLNVGRDLDLGYCELQDLPPDIRVGRFMDLPDGGGAFNVDVARKWFSRQGATADVETTIPFL